MMGKTRILVVEDESIIARNIIIALQDLGYSVSSFTTSGKEAVRKAKEDKPDLVLMDIVLQGPMDGIEAAEKIRSSFDIPVVFLSAYMDKDKLERSKITEPFGYILKPFKDKELHSTIEIALYKHKMEKELKNSKASFRSIIEKNADGILIVDKDGIVHFANPGAGLIFGRKVKEFLGKSFGLPLISGESTDIEIISSGGRKGVGEMRVMKTEWENERAFLVSIRDITERKTVEKALRKSQEKLKTIMESIDDVIFQLSPSGLIKYVSPNVKALYGYNPEELIGKHFKKTTPISQVPKALKALNSVLSGKTIRNFKIKQLDKKGKTVYMEINGSPVKNGEEIIAVQGVMRDITERKEVEKKLKQIMAEFIRSNTELKQFAYAVSHDLQEPLRTVMSFTQLLAKRYKGKLDSDADEFINFAVDGAVRMQDLIHALLAYSRVGTHGRDSEPIDCVAALNQTMTNLHISIEESGAVVTHDCLPTIMADSSQLVQLFQNLISNAIKYRKEGIPRIHISSRKKGNEWVFSVRDNGIGIEPQYSDRIFMIFQRLHSREEHSGVGIGLALCKKIAERHGGRIWVESKPGRGSTFYFTMPINKADKNEELRVSS